MITLIFPAPTLYLPAFIRLVCRIYVVQLEATARSDDVTVRFEEADGDMAAMLCGAAFTVPSGRTTCHQ